VADTIDPMDADAETDAAGTTTSPTLRIGRTERLVASPLAAAGDHAVLIRETRDGDHPRALLTTDKLASGERLVIMPLDDDVEVRVDGDALAVWLGSGSLQQVPPEQRPIEHVHAPGWATVVGGALLVLVLLFAVIGSAVVFTWLTRLFS
jgi:hypothetical protein